MDSTKNKAKAVGSQQSAGCSKSGHQTISSTGYAETYEGLGHCQTESGFDLEETYGGLFLLGCNGRLPAGDRGRRCSKWFLVRRDKPNGLKQASATHLMASTEILDYTQDTEKHLILYTFSEDESIFVEYSSDEEYDMFQIGRAYDKNLDVVVVGKCTEGKGKPLTSSVSKYACRVLANRVDKSNVRIYASAFNSNRKIVVGEKAVKWKKGSDVNVDALTTNGVLLSNPEGSFCGGELQSGVWREVSVCGNILSVRGPRSSQEKGREIETSTNFLRDGSLIDLCGATLLWRSAAGLKKCVNKGFVEKIFNKLNKSINELSSEGFELVIPRNNCTPEKVEGANKRHPYIYLNCGHVHGERTLAKVCPSCKVAGPCQNLCMGMEFSFYVDDVNDSHTPELFAFIPCGHIATEKTVKFWARTPLPHGLSGYQALCPFCATALQGYPGYVHLKFSGCSI